MKSGPTAIAVAVAWALLLVGESAGQCLDYGASPHWVSTFRPGSESVSGIAVVSPWIYVSSRAPDLYVIDATDPGALVVANTLDLPGEGFRIWCRPGLGLLTNRTGDLMFLDLANPAQPVVVDTIHFAEGVSDVAFTGDRVLVAAGIEGLVVLDVSNPDSVSVEGDWSDGSPYNQVEIVENLVYLGGFNRLVILDLTNPAEPIFRNSIPESLAGMDQDDDTLIAWNSVTLQIYDITDRLNPVLVSTLGEHILCGAGLHNGHLWYQTEWHLRVCSIPESGPADLIASVGLWGGEGYPSAVFHGGRVYAFSELAVRIIDLGDLRPAPPLKRTRVPNLPNDVAFRGDLMFAAATGDGPIVFDVSNPRAPRIIGSGYTEISAVLIDVEADVAVVAGAGIDDLGALAVFDISDPELPFHLGHLGGLPAFPEDLVFAGGIAWLALDANGVWGVDLRDPVHPAILHRIELTDSAKHLALDDGILHVTCYERSYWDTNSSYHLISIGDGEPAVVASVPLELAAGPVEVADGLAVVGHSYRGISLFDVTDPGAPRLHRYFDTMDGAFRVVLRGNHVFVGGGDGLAIVDVTNPLAPLGVGSIDMDGGNFAVLAGGEVAIWSIFGEDEIAVAPAPCCLGPVEPLLPVPTPSALAISPNPFNPSTKLSFVMPSPGHCRVAVHDLRGRHVRTLCDEVIAAGHRNFDWDGRDGRDVDMPSGVYVARVIHAGEVVTSKMVLVR